LIESDYVEGKWKGKGGKAKGANNHDDERGLMAAEQQDRQDTTLCQHCGHHENLLRHYYEAS
jgi:hypothetical protein